MVVSAGTATTIDLLQGSQDRQARFLGGWILPGLQTMDESLRRGTRDLDGLMGHPLTAQAIDMRSDGGPTAVHREIPRDSSLAISHGIGLAQTGFIYQIAQTHQVSRIWIHGGHASTWHARLIELEKDRPNFCAIVQEMPSVCFAGLLALAQYRI
jgi:pantothenate kinase type III